MPSVSIFGIGRMGGALAVALVRAGYSVDTLVYRSPNSVERIRHLLPRTTRTVPVSSAPKLSSDVILISTADPDIAPSAKTLEQLVTNRPVVLHTSGSLSSAILADLSAIGCSTGSLHPLVSISDPLSAASRFENIYFCVEGDEEARAVAIAIAESLDGTPFSIPTDRKPLYHAAAVTAAGHMTALMDVAIEILTECGVDAEAARRILLPLTRSAVVNLEGQAPPQALTGTFARADVSAFDRHLTSMADVTPDAVRQIYLLLGERSLDLALKNGVEASKVEELRERISIAKRKSE